MKSPTYVDKVPSSPIVLLGPIYKDERGCITMVKESGHFESWSEITSEANTTRASHWHKSDTHYCRVNSGEIWYYERKVGSTSIPKKTVIKSGNLFYTPAYIEHEMFFPVKTSFTCLSSMARNNTTYESDTTRLPIKLKDIYDKSKESQTE